MVTSLLHSAILSAAGTTVNQILSLDNVARKKLERLSGQVLRIDCELPEMVINILISDDRLHFSGAEDLKPETVIRGTGKALLKLLIKKETASLKSDGVVITGNVGLLTSLQDILQNIDLDWEYLLSKYAGDIPTQIVADTVSKAGSFTRQSTANLQQDIDDYLHQEKKIFPTADELNFFYQSVDSMRLRLDRLNSRVNRITPQHLS